MIDRFRIAVLDVTTTPERLTKASDYVAVGEDLLTPRYVAVEFSAAIYQRETPERLEVGLGRVRGLGTIREGVTSINQLEIHCIEEEGGSPIASINNRFLERLPMADLGLAVAARCSLTRWQDAHYVLEPVPTMPGMHRLEQLQMVMRRLEALGNDEPRPVSTPPKPALIDAEGIPWFHVQVVKDPMRLLSRQKRTRVTPDFLHDVWTVYTSAREAGEPTTEAVREWADLRTGRIPSNPTIFRWIQKARALHGEES
jgi:hypothetical protein